MIHWLRSSSIADDTKRKLFSWFHAFRSQRCQPLCSGSLPPGSVAPFITALMGVQNSLSIWTGVRLCFFCSVWTALGPALVMQRFAVSFLTGRLLVTLLAHLFFQESDFCHRSVWLMMGFRRADQCICSPGRRQLLMQVISQKSV